MKKGGFKKRVMSPEEKAAKLAELDAQLAVLEEKQAFLKEQDPFWFYEPSDGTVSPEGKKLLEEVLRPEDIPQRCDGQLDVHMSSAKIRAAFGGNQVGKSTIAMIEAMIRVCRVVPVALKGKVPEWKLKVRGPVHVRIVCQDYVNGFLKNMLPAAMNWVPREYLLDRSWLKSWRSENRTLTLYDTCSTHGPSNAVMGTIEFMSNDQDVSSFQGPPRDLIIYDEQPRKDIRDENLMRFTTRGNLDELYTMTPTEGLTWTYEEILLKEDGTTIQCFKLATVTNKRANLENLRLVLKSIADYNTLKMRLLGEFVSLTGLVYGNLYDPKIHDIKPFEYRCTCRDEIRPPSGAHPDGCPWNAYCGIRGMDSHLVTPTHMVQYVLDSEGNKYIVGCYSAEADTELVKRDLAQAAQGIRQTWTVVDKSTDSDIEAFGGRNIFKELKRDPNRIPALRKSQKFDGSIKTGVDAIKQDLRVNPGTGKPRLFIFDIPETKPLRAAFRMLQKDSFADPDRGPKDKILESKWHLHAAARYPYQFKMNWIAPVDYTPQANYGTEAYYL